MVPIVGKSYKCLEHLILPRIDAYHQQFIREEKIVKVLKRNDKVVEVLAKYANGDEVFKIPTLAFNVYFIRTNEKEKW